MSLGACVHHCLGIGDRKRTPRSALRFYLGGDLSPAQRNRHSGITREATAKTSHRDSLEPGRKELVDLKQMCLFGKVVSILQIPTVLRRESLTLGAVLEKQRDPLTANQEWALHNSGRQTESVHYERHKVCKRQERKLIS